MTDMTTYQNNAVATTDDFDPYAEYGRQNANQIVGKLMKFAKGDWLVGNDEIEQGTQMLAGIRSLLIGWIKWEDNKPVENLMGLLEERHKPQARKELGDLDESDWPIDNQGKPQDPWQLTNYLPLMDLKTDAMFTFTTSSAGGRNAISALCRDFGAKRRMYPNKLPVVALGVDSYVHKDKNLGRIKVPEFKIVSWVDETKFGVGDVDSPSTQPDMLDMVGRGNVGTDGGTTARAQEKAKF